MARLKNGTVTGQFDSRLGAIKAGDAVKCNTDGIKYTVDGFGGIFNESGAHFRVKDWNPGDFTIVESTAPEPKAKRAPFEVNEEFQESIAAAEMAIAGTSASEPASTAPSNSGLSKFGDKELADELASRGYVGYVSKTVCLNIG